ncbi:MAG: MFS transporter [Deltaproteobacteria bacterium]|nr:MAG: MFS transporter [Deltaproteobacteria bacterium]
MLPEATGEAMPRAGARRWLINGFPALRHRNFRLFVAGQGVSLIGTWMQSVAQSWLVYRLSGSRFALGLVAFAGYLPILCLAPAAGVVADRVDRQRLIILTQALAMLLALALGVLVAARAVSVPAVVLVAGCLGAVSAFDIPVRQSFIVEMVGAEDLPNAIALNSSIFNAARVVGPALAGSLVAAVGEAACFFLNAASYLAVLAALLSMRLERIRRSGEAPAHVLAGFLSGLDYVRREPALRNLLVLLGVVSGLGLQYAILIPVFAKEIFHAGATGYGLLVTAAGIGSVVSALHLAARRYSRAQHRRNLLVGLAMFSIGVLGLTASRRLGLALWFQALAGYGAIRYLATTNTLLQLLVDERYRGRVMGLHTVMFLGTASAGSLVVGALAQKFGASPAAAFAGSVSLACVCWLGTRLRRLAVRERRAAA